MNRTFDWALGALLFTAGVLAALGYVSILLKFSPLQ